MKRYVVIEVDEGWTNNAVMDKVQALPCISSFHGPMSAREACVMLEPEALEADDEERKAAFEAALPKVGEAWSMASNGKRYEVTRVERTEGYPWAVVYSVGQDAAGMTREMDCPIKAWFALFELCQRVP